MRHNYVGDEGDYAKLALLRALEGHGQLGVNWYLTVHEEGEGTPGGADGNKLAHLQEGDEDWLYLDDALLVQMRRSLERWIRGDRHIAHLEAMLPGAVVFAGELPTGDPRYSPAQREARRQQWHRDALAALAGADVVFVDPDNGFEVKSHGPRSKRRCKYAAYSEVADYLARGQAVVAYQHRPRVTWEKLVATVKAELRSHDVPTAVPGFIAFGSRGFFLMHRDPAVVARMMASADEPVRRSDMAAAPRLTITVVPPA